jgi:hypothetical protein
MAIFKSEGMQPGVRDEFMWELRNGRKSLEIVWRREEGMGTSGQVVGQSDLSYNIYFGES